MSPSPLPSSARNPQVVRIVAVVDVDTTRCSLREFRKQAAEAWRASVLRARSAGRIELTVAEELIRAWPGQETLPAVGFP